MIFLLRILSKNTVFALMILIIQHYTSMLHQICGKTTVEHARMHGRTAPTDSMDGRAGRTEGQNGRKGLMAGGTDEQNG